MYESLVETAREIFLKHQELENNKNRQSRNSEPALWPSSLLNCKRKVAHQLLNEPVSLPFSYQSLSYMDGGMVLEDATARALKHVYNAEQNLQLRHGNWSGKVDFVIGHKTSKAVLIEHKATGEGNFKRSGALPKREHVAQLALYGYLYNLKHDIEPELILYYIGWGHYADFTLTVRSNTIGVIGLIDNNFVSRNLRIDIKKEIADLEKVYEQTMKGDPLPPRLQNKSAGCTWAGKPSCPFYYSCYPNERNTHS